MIQGCLWVVSRWPPQTPPGAFLEPASSLHPSEQSFPAQNDSPGDRSQARRSALGKSKPVPQNEPCLARAGPKAEQEPTPIQGAQHPPSTHCGLDCPATTPWQSRPVRLQHRPCQEAASVRKAERPVERARPEVLEVNASTDADAVLVPANSGCPAHSNDLRPPKTSHRRTGFRQLVRRGHTRFVLRMKSALLHLGMVALRSDLSEHHSARPYSNHHHSRLRNH